MANLDDLVVKLKADTRDFGQKLAEAEGKIKQFGSGATGALSGLSTLFSPSGALLLGVGALSVAIGAATAKVIEFGASSVKAYSEAESSQVKLQSALQATGRFSEEAFNKILASSAAMQRATTQEDDALTEATSKLALLAKGLSTDELIKAQQAMVGLASVLKIDVAQAATLVGKTVGSTTNAFGRYGIAIDTTGSQSEKLNQIIKATAEYFKQAQAEVNTNTGAHQRLQNIMGDLREAIGSIITDTLEMSNVMNGLSEVISGLTGYVNENRGAIIALGQGTINAFAGIFNSAKGLWHAFEVVVYGISNAVTSAVNIAVRGVLMLVNESIRNINRLIGLLNKIPNVKLGTIGTVKAGGLTGYLNTVNLRFSKATTGAMGNFWNSIAGGGNIVGMGGNKRSGRSGGGGSAAGGGGGSAAGGGGGGKSGASKALKDFDRESDNIIKKFLSTSEKAFKDFSDKKEQIFNDFRGLLKQTYTDWEKYNEEIIKATEGFKAGAGSAEDYAKIIRHLNESMLGLNSTQIVTSQQQANIIKSAQNMAKIFTESSQNIFTNQKSNTDETLNAIGELQNAVQGFGRQFEDTLVTAFTTGKFNFKDMIGSMLADLTRLILRLTVIQPIVNSLTKGIGGGGGISGLFGRLVGGLFGKGKSSTGGLVSGFISGAIAGRASGGHVAAGFPYIVGERKPEIFVPSTSGSIKQASGMGGNGNVVYLSQSFNISAGVPEAVRVEIQKQMPMIVNQTTGGVMAAVGRGGKVASRLGAR